MTTDLTKWFNKGYAILDPSQYHDHNFVAVQVQDLIAALTPNLGRQDATHLEQDATQAGYVLNKTSNENTFVKTRLDADADDFIITGNGSDGISTGLAEDLVLSGQGHDYVNAGGGADVVLGGKGNDTVDGGAGDGWILGDAQVRIDQGPDSHGIGLGIFSAIAAVATGGASLAAQSAVVAGGASLGLSHLDKDNELTSQNFLKGMRFGEGKEPAYIRLDQGSGADSLKGGEGNDIIMGGLGSDILEGGNGKDILDSGPRGANLNYGEAWGGEGEDVFYLGTHVRQDSGDTVWILSNLKSYIETREIDVSSLINAPGSDAGFVGFVTGLFGAETVAGLRPEQLLDALQAFVDAGNVDISTFAPATLEERDFQDWVQAQFEGLDIEQTGADMGLAVTGEVIGTVLPFGGDVLNEGLTMFVNWARGLDDKTPETVMDYVRVMDFNPEEDVLALPMKSGVSVVFEPEIQMKDSQPEVTLNLKYCLDNSAASDRTEAVSATFAVIHLDTEWAGKIGIAGTAIERTHEFWTDLLKTTVSLGQARHGEEIVTGSDPGTVGIHAVTDDTMDPSIGYLQLIGSVGTIIRNGSGETSAAPMVGGGSGDFLTLNETFDIAPGEEVNTVGTVPGDLRTESPVDVYGLGGDDHIYGSRMTDKLYGGDGDDKIWGFGNTGGGTEIMEGGAGNDEIYVGRPGLEQQVFLDPDTGAETARTVVSYGRYAIDGGENEDGSDDFDTMSFQYRTMERAEAGTDVAAGHVGRSISLKVEHGDVVEASALGYERTSHFSNFEAFVGTGLNDSFQFRALERDMTVRGGDGADMMIVKDGGWMSLTMQARMRRFV